MAVLPGTLVCMPRALLAPAGDNLNWTSCLSSRTTALGFSGVRPWNSLVVTSSNRSVRPWRHIMAVPKAAQTEAKEDEEEEELLETEEESTVGENGLPYTSLLERLKAALAADDEVAIANIEAQQRALEEDRDSLAKQVANLLEEANTARERLLRLNADFENFRKRTATEKANLFSSAKGDVIEALLPMVDNFERAKSSIVTETEAEQKIDKSYQGIYKQFVEIMKGFGVVAVETVGKLFDPNLHEAIMREESTEFPEGIVVQEFRRGFSIGEKLIRPAMVKVSSGPGPAAPAPDVEGEASEETKSESE